MKKLIKNDPAVFILLLLSAVLFALNAWILWQGGTTAVEKIRRNDYEKEARQVTAVMETEIDGRVYRRNVDLTVAPMDLTEEEKTKRLDRFEQQLGNRILGENKDPMDIVTDLDLITKDPATGITLLWSSSDPSRIDERGRVYPSGEPGAPVELHAVLELDGLTREWSTRVTHNCIPEADNLQRALSSDLSKITEGLNEDASTRYAVLPKELDSGIKVTWRAPVDHRYFLIGGSTLLLAFFLYRKKRSDQKNDREKRMQEIRKDFPYFLDKLVMLLSAGVILTESVYRIWGDYERFQQVSRPKILYEELGEAVRTMRNSNAAFSAELIRMSERLQVREFARLAVILRDSLGSGNDLAAKLENESILMWRERKSSIQTLGRVADTKLIFPLMIILTVLIIIVMTPAVLQL